MITIVHLVFYKTILYMKTTVYVLALTLLIACSSDPERHNESNLTYLDNIKHELTKKFPTNRTINFVFHGHSVPAGYHEGGIIKPFESYPLLFLRLLKEDYPYASVNIINTSVGGATSREGYANIEVALSHHPDVLILDFGLNDRKLSMDSSRFYWQGMIQKALSRNIKVIALTPSPDLKDDITDSQSKLSIISGQIIDIAIENRIGYVDVRAAFRELVLSGKNLKKYMAIHHHPNIHGHKIIADKLYQYLNP